jgi:hypothetical protein
MNRNTRRERIKNNLQIKKPHLVGQAGVLGQDGAGDGVRTVCTRTPGRIIDQKVRLVNAAKDLLGC